MKRENNNQKRKEKKKKINIDLAILSSHDNYSAVPLPLWAIPLPFSSTMAFSSLFYIQGTKSLSFPSYLSFLQQLYFFFYTSHILLYFLLHYFSMFT